MERILNELVERLTKTFGERLVSIVLYGSAAAGDHDPEFSDYNVLCVLADVTPRELGDSEPIFRWWREKGNPSPLLLSEDEVRTSTDCFPIEFQDIRARHRILAGRDIVAGMDIDTGFYRAYVERELRAKLLRLRQKAAGVQSDRSLLLEMMAASVSTFCILFRHALVLAGHEPRWTKREVIALAAEKFAMDPQPFFTLLDVRGRASTQRTVDAGTLLGSYLAEIGKVVDRVDRLAR
jgi:predicted nucleotidyltransferase